MEGPRVENADNQKLSGSNACTLTTLFRAASSSSFQEQPLIPVRLLPNTQRTTSWHPLPKGLGFSSMVILPASKFEQFNLSPSLLQPQGRLSCFCRCDL